MMTNASRPWGAAARAIALGGLIVALAGCGGPRKVLSGAGAGNTAPEVTTGAMAAEAPERRGLFEIAAASVPSDRRDDAAPSGLPFGQIATVCGADPALLGPEVARSPGKERFALHDTSPTSIAPRVQFLTGFKDGCARQFTASLALFGTAQVHEATRYNPLNTTPYSAVDEAYEAIKARICRTDRGEYCTGRRATRMERDVVFLSVYRDFGGTGQWMEILLHKGELVAHSVLGQ